MNIRIALGANALQVTVNYVGARLNNFQGNS